MPPTTPSPRQRLASVLLQRDVIEFIRERRHAGESWTSVARSLKEATNSEISVTGEAVRQWSDAAEPLAGAS